MNLLVRLLVKVCYDFFNAPIGVLDTICMTFPMTLSVHLSVGRLGGRSVGRKVCHNFLKRQQCCTSNAPIGARVTIFMHFPKNLLSMSIYLYLFICMFIGSET